MGKKMNFLFPFKSSSHSQTPPSSWPWRPSACTTPKTLSFRATINEEEAKGVFKTINCAYFESSPKSCFNGSSVFDESFSTAPEIIPEEEEGDEDSIETVIRGLRRSERLFFEPETKSIIKESSSSINPFKESSSAIAVDSMDPFGDFKKSMEEMVEAHGLKDWECLQELLTCYLKVNNKSNHGYIIGAFVDLLVAIAFANSSPPPPPPPPPSHDDLLLLCSSSTTNSFTSPLSFSSSSTFSNSPCLSSLDVDDEKSVNNGHVFSSSSVSNS